MFLCRNRYLNYQHMQQCARSIQSAWRGFVEARACRLKLREVRAPHGATVHEAACSWTLCVRALGLHTALAHVLQALLFDR